jgi:hypothetical protein
MIESLLLTFYRMAREAGGKVNHQPSGDQLLYWVETGIN